MNLSSSPCLHRARGIPQPGSRSGFCISSGLQHRSPKPHWAITTGRPQPSLLPVTLSYLSPPSRLQFHPLPYCTHCSVFLPSPFLHHVFAYCCATCLCRGRGAPGSACLGLFLFLTVNRTAMSFGHMLRIGTDGPYSRFSLAF